jgi:adenylyltransferase/sulfurtransferase
MVAEMSPTELKARLGSRDAPLVLDVREPWELQICRLERTVNIPMGEIAGRIGELPRDRALVVLCRSGGRSMQVASYLEQLGYSPVFNLTGGILAWGLQIDPSVEPY